MARTPIRYTNFDGLLNNGVSDFLLQDNELTACKNVWMYKIGKLEKVPGYTKSASNTAFLASQPLGFLHYYYDTDNAVHYMIGGGYNGTQTVLKHRTTAGWSTVDTFWTTGGLANLSAQNYLGKAFIVGEYNGTFLSPASVDGTTYTQSNIADPDLTNFPKAKYIVTFRDFLYVLNCEVGGTKYPSRAYYCDYPTNKTVVWNTTEFLEEYGQDDGDVITGAAEACDRLIVFKTYSMWKDDRSTQKKIADVGCDSYRSIKVIQDTVYWFNRHGFYRWSGSTPQLISERAKEYIDGIDPTKLDQVVACEFYKGEYRAYIGNVTVNKILYHNAWFCFDTIRERCYIRCTYWDASTSDTVKAAVNYMEGGQRRAYFGDNNGYLYKFAEKADRIFADDGHEIDSFFETKLLDHGVPEDVKFTNHLTVFTKNNHGMKVAVDKDNMGEFSEDNEDTLNQNVQQVEIAGSANRFKYRFYEKSDGLSWEFEGFVVETQIKEEGYPQ